MTFSPARIAFGTSARLVDLTGINVEGVAANTNGAASGTITVTLPANVADEIMTVMISVDSTFITMVDTAGWTTDFKNNVNIATTFGVYHKKSTGSEANMTVTWTGGNVKAVGLAIVLSGVDTVSPIDVLGALTTGSGTIVDTANLTTTVNNAFVLGAISRDRTSGGFTPDVGWIDRGNLSNSPEIQGMLCSRKFSNAGAIGVFNHIISFEQWSHRAIAFKPAS